MNNIKSNLVSIKEQLPSNVNLVAVSKTKPVEDLQEAYDAGQRIFGENKIQEMTQKWELLPKDIQWHMIGSVQTNKVKYMAPYVSLIHAVDSLKLLKEINKQALKNNRTIDCLLQVKIAKEDSKQGMSFSDLKDIVNSTGFSNLDHINIVGLMGMATNTQNKEQINSEFRFLKECFEGIKSYNTISNINITTLSMGMSGDFDLAIKQGSNMIRVGSAIFGKRNYNI